MNHNHPVKFASLLLAMLVLLISCSAYFNWRAFKFSEDELTFMLPCKPDEASKEVQIGEEKQNMTMAACNVGDLNFTISRLKRPKNVTQEAMFELWQKASWYAVSGPQSQETPVAQKIEIKINNKSIAAQELTFEKNMKVHWRWFEQGSWTYQLGIYFSKDKYKGSLSQETIDMFFNAIE